MQPHVHADNAATPTRRPRRSARMRRMLGELWADKAGFLGLLVLIGIIGAAIAAPLLAPHDPAAQSLQHRLAPPFWQDGGSVSHPLGTDNLGRDVLSRLLFGARTSLIIGVLAVLLAGGAGTALGVVAGFRGGLADTLIMRFIDIQVAFPGLLLALMILMMVGPSVTTVIVVLSISNWMVFARITRGLVLSIRELPFVEAAEVVGCRSGRVIVRHVLPSLISPLLSLAVLELANVILAEAAMSFLGLGIQPPAVSWGLDVAIGQDYIYKAWWLVTFPGAAIAVTVLATNLLASWLRVIADPQQRDNRYADGADQISAQRAV
jgi:peptide/nickel transport system permease protein